MATAGHSFMGVKRRKSSGKNKFEMRYGDQKLYSSKIKSAEEGALCYDLAQRYKTSETVGGKRKEHAEFNFPGYSLSLPLKPLPSDFDIKVKRDKKWFMELILTQARAAARNLPESLSPSNRSSSHQNVHNNPPRVAEGTQDLPGVCTNVEVQTDLQIYELSLQCHDSRTSKALERQELEMMVANIREDSGYVSVPKCCPDEFRHIVDCLKEKLGMAEQEHKSDEIISSELRNRLQDHNLIITEKLMEDGNKMTGRQRADVSERLPELQNVPVDFSVPISPWSPGDLNDSDLWTRLEAATRPQS